MGERRHHPHGHGGTTPFFAGLVRGAPAGSLPGGLMPPGTNEAIPSSVPPLGPSGAGPVPPRPKTAARAASNSTTPSCPLTPILHPWSTWEGSYDQEDAFLRRRFSMFGRSSAVESAFFRLSPVNCLPSGVSGVSETRVVCEAMAAAAAASFCLAGFGCLACGGLRGIIARSRPGMIMADS